MYLVIDIGGTFIKYGLMDTEGNLHCKNKKRTTTENLIAFKNILYEIVEAHDLTNIKGIALSCPGTIDVNTGMIYYGGSYPFLHKVNLACDLQEKYGKKVTIENDGKCAALAELWQGSLKEVNDAVVLILGSGVGGGIILNRQLHRGINLSAGELSYVMSNIDIATKKGRFVGNDCSAVKMVKHIAEIKQLDDLTDGVAVFDYINSGDKEANEIFDEYCLYIAAQIMNLQYIFDPELFSIGGGISSQPILHERIHWAMEQLRKENPFHVAKPVVVPCKFLSDANLYGALYQFLKGMKKGGEIVYE